jgi:hypothetical protein
MTFLSNSFDITLGWPRNVLGVHLTVQLPADDLLWKGC